MTTATKARCGDRWKREVDKRWQISVDSHAGRRNNGLFNFLYPFSLCPEVSLSHARNFADRLIMSRN